MARPTDVPIPGLEIVLDLELVHPPVADVPRPDPFAFELRPPRETDHGQTRLDFTTPQEPTR